MACTCFVAACIMLSTAIVIVESLPRLQGTRALLIIHRCAVGLTAVFAIELVLRVVACPDLRKLLRDVHTWIDVFALAPVLIELVRPLPCATPPARVARAV